FFIQAAEAELRGGKLRRRSAFQPAHGLGGVLRNAAAFQVADGDLVFGAGIALEGGFAQRDRQAVGQRGPVVGRRRRGLRRRSGTGGDRAGNSGIHNGSKRHIGRCSRLVLRQKNAGGRDEGRRARGLR